MNEGFLRHWFSFFALLTAFSGPLAAQSADLLVTKSGPAEAPAGSNVSYSVTITNLGPDDASSVSLDDPIPVGMTFVSTAQTSGPVFTCSNPPVGSGGTVSCSLTSFAAGSSADFTLVFQIPPATPPGTLFLNIATATSVTFDPNDENDSGIAATSTPPPPTADMGISKSGPNSAGPDTDVVFTISVTNAGPDAAASVVWQDTLPGNLTFVALGQNSGPVMTCSTPAVGSGGTISCTIATFPAGPTATFTLTGHVPSGTPSGTPYLNTASVSAATADPNDENDSSTSFFTVSTVDVSVTKAGTGTAPAGSNANYTLTVSNAGPNNAVNVELSDALPPGTTFVSLTQDTGPVAVCDTPFVGSSGTVTCTFATLNSGISAQFTLVINTGSAASYTNTASVTTDSFDTDASDNSAGADTAVTQSAGLSILKTGPATVNAGADVTYTVTVANAGPSNATSVSLTDVLPPGTTFVSATQSVGPVFSCVTPAVGATGTITCGIATLPAGTSATFTFVLQVALAATGTIDNQANLTSGTADPDPDDNSSTASAAVIPAPPDIVEIPTLSPALLGLFALALAAAALALQRRAAPPIG